MRVVFKNQDLCIWSVHLVSIVLSLLSGPLRGHIHTHTHTCLHMYLFLHLSHKFMMKAMSSHWYLYFWSSTIRLFWLFSFPYIYLHFLRIRSWLPLSQPPYVWPVFWFSEAAVLYWFQFLLQPAYLLCSSGCHRQCGPWSDASVGLCSSPPQMLSSS